MPSSSGAPLVVPPPTFQPQHDELPKKLEPSSNSMTMADRRLVFCHTGDALMVSTRYLA
ncbi:hypothetical protein D3C87_1152830 [compost metagenome]